MICYSIKFHLTNNRAYFEPQLKRSEESWSLLMGRIDQIRVCNIHIILAAIEEVFGVPCELLQWNEDNQQIIPWIPPQSCADAMNGSRNDAIDLPPINESQQHQRLLFTPPTLPFCILQVGKHLDSLLSIDSMDQTFSLQQNAIPFNAMRLAGNTSILALHAQ